MKFQGLLFAALLLAALTGFLYWSNHHKPAEASAAVTPTESTPKILSLNESDISRVALDKKNGPNLILAKDAQGKWKIESPESLDADQSAVSGVVSALSSLSSERLVEDKADNLSQFGLNSPTLEVDVADKGNTHKLLIGDDTPTSNGAYAKLENDPRVFTIASYVKSSIDKGINDLRDKRLITVEPDKITRVDLKTTSQELEFGRDKDQWQILKPKPMRADGFQVDELVRKLTGATMDISSPSDEKQTSSTFTAAKPVGTAKLTSARGTQELDIRKNKNDYYAKSSIVSGEYKVSTDLGTSLDKKLDDFRNKKLFDFGYTDPEKIEVHDASKSYFLTKKGEDWWSGDGKKLDAVGAESVLDKIRDLQATKFAESGFAAPIIEISVTSNAGKRVEKVQIAKHGDDYIAKRLNEPDLYLLEAKTVDALQKSFDELKPAAQPKK